MWFRTLSLSAMIGLHMAGAAVAQNYPNRTITFVSGYQAGSSSDAIARFIAEKVKPLAGQTIVVENRQGANTVIATEHVVRSKPDGYTIFISSPAGIAANDALLKSPPANTDKALRVAATINRQAFILAVDSSTPYKTLADLTAAMKPKGAKASFATYAPSGTLTGALYKAATGIEAVEVVYRVGAQSLNDIQSGALDFGVYDPLFALAQERSGRFRLLAIVSQERLQTSPNVPTFTELGMPFAVTAWFSAIIPAATPQPIVDQINAWFVAAVQQADTKAFLNNIGSEPWALSSEDANKYFLSEFENYRKIVAAAKIERQ